MKKTLLSLCVLLCATLSFAQGPVKASTVEVKDSIRAKNIWIKQLPDLRANLIDAKKATKSVGNIVQVMDTLMGGLFTVHTRSEGYRSDSVMVYPMADTNWVLVRNCSYMDLKASYFGLVGDGVTDNYDAFQRMVRWTNKRGGNITITFDPGIYYIDTMKTGTPITKTLIDYDTTVTYDTDGNPETQDSTVDIDTTTLTVFSNKYTPNNISNIDFVLVSNVKLIGYGAVISVKGNFNRTWTHSTPSGHTHMSAFNSVCPMEFRQCKNIWIEGLEFNGNVDKMTKDTIVNEGDDYGVIFRGCFGVIMKNVFVHHFATDGIYIEGGGPVPPPYSPSRDVVFENVRSWYNGRQALTIGALYHGQFNNCEFSHTNDNSTGQMGNYPGHSPMKGCDIEPIFAYPTRINLMTSEIEFNNCEFVANRGGAFASSLYRTVKNVRFNGGTMNSYPYAPRFLIVPGLQNFICEGMDMTFTGRTSLYLLYGTNLTKRHIWRNNTFIVGGNLQMSGFAQYGVTFENNLVIGRHDTAYNDYFPNFNGAMTIRNNTFVLDSNLYSSTAFKKGQIQNATVVEGNTFISQMDTTGGRMYTISYANSKTIRNERYTPGQAVRPLNATTYDFTNNTYFSTGEVGVGFRQVAYIGSGKTITTSYNTTTPTSGKYNVGDIVVMTDPAAAGFDHLRCVVAGDFSLGQTPVFSQVGTITADGGPVVYKNGITQIGSNIYAGEYQDSNGLNKLATAFIPKGASYFTKNAPDTGLVVFKPSFAFDFTGDLAISGSIYTRTKGNATFTITTRLQGNKTTAGTTLTIQGDSSFATMKVRLMKDAADKFYITLFDTTSILLDKSVVRLNSVTLSGATDAFLASAAIGWSTFILKSLSGYTTLATPTNANSVNWNFVYNKPLNVGATVNITGTDNTYSREISAILGSRMITENITIDRLGTSGVVGSGMLRLTAVFVPRDTVLTGTRWFQATAGSYTASGYNGVGLYSYVNGVATLVASSADDGATWVGTSGTYNSKNFTTPYNATKGVYYIAWLYNASAATTAPAVGTATTIISSGVLSSDFNSGAKLTAQLTSQTSLPATITMTATTAILGQAYASLY